MSKRIESVDLLRGFTIAAMILVNTPGTWISVYSPLLHAEWHGLTPTDLIFPFFLFIVGISIYFAYRDKPGNVFVYKKIFVRSIKLIGLGLILNLFLPYYPFIKDYETLRLPGVLQRIGIVFFISSVLYINFNWKFLVSICVLILLGYWIFLGVIPFPDGTLPTYDRAPNNWANYIDLNILGSHMWQSDYDPEGILSTIPSIVTCILGILVGKLLDEKASIQKLFLVAFFLLILGYSLDVLFPINKAIWSSSFVLATAGWATLILSVIFYFRDIKKLQFGSYFKYIGMNAITIYFLSSFISKSMYLLKIGNTNIHNFLYDTVFVHSFISDKLSSLLYALTVVLFYLGLGLFMYRKNIFIKV